MPQPKASQRRLKRHTPRPLPRRRRMVIPPTVLIHPVPPNPPSRRTTPVQLLRRAERTTQTVREGFRFHVVVVFEAGVVDRGAGAPGAGPGCYVEVGGLVGVAAGGILGAGGVC